MRYIVIAPTYQQVVQWCRENDQNQRDIIAVTNTTCDRALRGRRWNPDDVVVWNYEPMELWTSGRVEEDPSHLGDPEKYIFVPGSLERIRRELLIGGWE